MPLTDDPTAPGGNRADIPYTPQWWERLAQFVPPPFDWTDPRTPPPYDPGIGNEWVFGPRLDPVSGDPVGGIWQINSIPTSLLTGGGGTGRVQFPSEAALDAAQTAYYLAQAQNLPADLQASIANQQTQNYLTALSLQLQQRDITEQNYLDALRTGGGLQLDLRTIEETERANRAREAEDARRRGLDAATASISAYLRATELADARRLAAVQEQRALLPFMVDPNQQFFSGLGPDSPLAAAAGAFGLPFEPVPIQHTTINAAGLAETPQIPGGSILDYLNRLQQLGAV